MKMCVLIVTTNWVHEHDGFEGNEVATLEAVLDIIKQAKDIVRTCTIALEINPLILENDDWDSNR